MLKFMILRIIRFILLVILTQFAYAQDFKFSEFANNEQEKRYYKLIKEIRCPVCQGQSIGGSNSGLAKDLRQQVKNMLIANKSDEEIFLFMRERYGDFIVFEPPVNRATYLLWYAPFIFLLLLVLFIARWFIKK